MICDQRLVDMHDDERVAIIEQPDGSMLDMPVRVARNGGAVPVHSNAQGSKSASAPNRAVKFKKQRLAESGSSQVRAADPMEAHLPIQDLHSCSL